MFSTIWNWGGRHRVRETNIGIAPDQIAVTLRSDLDSLRFRWTEVHDLNERELGIAAHATVVRIHPFVDGNGRATRLLGDLVLMAARPGADAARFDWNLDRANYIRLLNDYDRTRDPRPLAAFVHVQSVSE